MNGHGKLTFGNMTQLFPINAHSFSDGLLDDLAQKEVAIEKTGTTRIPAGFTYFGQFLTHEVTRMHVSDQPLGGATIPAGNIFQLRSPPFDMDSLYGAPDGFGKDVESAEGRFTSDSTYFLPNGRELIFDLPRKEDGTAKIGDSRNDENFLIAQLHVLFLNLHNRLLELHLEDKSQEEAIKAARAELILLFQAVTVNDFLRNVLKGRVFSNLFLGGIDEFLINPSPGDGSTIPIEFAGAAFRFGHSMVRSTYNIGQVEPMGLSRMFELTQKGNHWEQIDSSTNIVKWPFQFDMRKYGGPDNFDHTLPIDTFLTAELRDMKNEPAGQRDLVERNLKKSRRINLPSAQSIIEFIQEKRGAYAGKMGLELLQLADMQTDNVKFKQVVRKHNLNKHAPLWSYILLEPGFFESDANKHTYLGTLGSVLIGEVIRSLLITSKTSIWRNNAEMDDSVLMQYMRSHFFDQRVTWQTVQMSDLIQFIYH